MILRKYRTVPRITVKKKSQISYFPFSLYAKKCFKTPVALGSENLDPPKSVGVLLLNSVQPGSLTLGSGSGSSAGRRNEGIQLLIYEIYLAVSDYWIIAGLC